MWLDKETRARPFAAQCEAGNVHLVQGKWIEAYLNEVVEFPVGRYADQVDASSGAFGSLIMYPKRDIISGGMKGLY
jgi:predicted phage terminase large subunit-like protein